MPFRTSTTANEALDLAVKQVRASKRYLQSMSSNIASGRKVDDVYRVQQHFLIVRKNFLTLSGVPGIKDVARTMYNDAGYDILSEFITLRQNMKDLKDTLDTLIPQGYVPPVDEVGNTDEISGPEVNDIVSKIGIILDDIV